MQHMDRGYGLGPCAGFQTWKSRNRNVKKGEKGLCVLAPMKAMVPTVQNDGTTKLVEKLTGFRIQRTTFTFSQTEGEDWTPEEVSIAQVTPKELTARLGITVVPFEDIDGNTQGYAKAGRQIAVSPIAANPEHTFLHEIAHVVLGHTEEGTCSDGAETPRSLREAEAEGVVYIIQELFAMKGSEYSRGYIQSWWQEKGLPEGSSKKIFSAVEKITRAIRNQEQRASLPKAA